MDQAPDNKADGDVVPSLKWLRWLVTTLMVVMIAGFIVLIALLVTRFPGAATVDLPDAIALPDGTVPVAFTQTVEWWAVVTEANEILIFDRNSGEITQTVKILRD